MKKEAWMEKAAKRQQFEEMIEENNFWLNTI